MKTGLQNLLRTEKNIITRFFSCRPIVSIALAYAAGTGLGLKSTALPLTLLMAALSTLMILLVLTRKHPSRKRSSIYLHAIVIIVAALTADIHPRACFQIHPVRTEKLSVKGVVISDPDIRSSTNRYIIRRQFILRVEEKGLLTETRQQTHGRVNVFWYGPENTRMPSYGERWLITGKAHDWKKDGCTSISAHHRDACFISEGHGSSFARKCYAARKSAASYLSMGMTGHDDATALLKAILLGYRDQLPRHARNVFVATGTLHIFAISGLHVGIITMLIVFVLHRFGISRVYWILFLAPLLIAYTLATGAKPSAVRACIMAISYYLAPLLGRKADSFSTLAFAALMILVWNPLQLMNVGFIYSFVVVAGLIILCPLFDKPLHKIWKHDDELIPHNIEMNMNTPLMSTLGAIRQKTLRYICGLVALSCSAWLVSAPLTAYFFGRFSPIALISNIAVIPLALAIVFTGCLSLVLGACISWLAVAFNYVNLLLASLLIKTMLVMSRIPFSSIEIDKPPLWTVLLWYTILSLLALRSYEKQKN